ncbi:DUF1214 domain-containing protein [Polycladidibacter hongkongensis]|uniref:DUF1214 domain-containing protein n=1 Tax=Polycladidibacter hongkongensis TaxID=1647556 RepID=UPI00082D9F4A|nr:DUF1214 domain-containing protein [Pseudovibrio hongkongensis]
MDKKQTKAMVIGTQPTPYYDGENSWQKPWPKVSRLLYRARMLSFGPYLFFLVVSLVVGVGSAYYALNHGAPFNAVHEGVWVAYPNAGTPEDDPYSVAIFSRTKRLALGRGEGLAFYAVQDELGQPLDARCTYVLEGAPLPARLWTLTALDGQMHIRGTDAGRAWLHSRDLLRSADGNFRITISPQAQAGNWLPTGGDGQLTLALRMYDNALAGEYASSRRQMPGLRRSYCQ